MIKGVILYITPKFPSKILLMYQHCNIIDSDWFSLVEFKYDT